MLLWHHKYSLPLLSLVFLLSIHSVQASSVRRHFADAKSILTSTKFLDVEELFHGLRESVLPGSSHSVEGDAENTGRVVHTTRRVRQVQSSDPAESASGGNFVIIASSPGKNGHIISVPETTDKEIGKLGSHEEPLSSSTPVTILRGQPIETNSNDEDNSKEDNTIDSESKASIPPSTSGPVPKADVYLDVTAGAGNPKDSISIDSEPKPTDETLENTFEVELSVFDPSTEEFLNANGTESAAPRNDDDDSSDIDKQNDSDELNPQPSVAPGPIEQPVILVPPDIEEGEKKPHPDDLDNRVPIESANAVSTSSFESVETTETTPESASPNPREIDAASPLNESRNEYFPVNRDSPQEAAEASVEPTILVDIPLSVWSSERSISPEFDEHSRNFLGETTGTTASQWKPTKMSTTVRTIRRQDGSRWEITYQGQLSKVGARKIVDKLEKGINEGDMDAYLSKRLSTKVTVRTVSAPVLDTSHKDEVSLGTVPKETFSGNATTNKEEEGGGQSLGVILGTCFGLLGALIAAAAAFAFVRRRRGNDVHVLDGVATVPTTITSFETDRSESQFRSGAPTKPRGPDVLRNQSRVLDWQLDHAKASGEVRHILGRGNGRDEEENV